MLCVKKGRSFTIINFQTKEDLNKACTSTAKYFNYILTWSKSIAQYIQAMPTRYRKRRFQKDQEMAMEDSSIGSMEGTQNQAAECSRQVNRNPDRKL